ncbi:MAG TPA: carboxypeptidase-like regulatory domain-containing protein [Gemmatimonadaceae bacterium]|nr:carboxypeptidase-like regulatory domain-containing protein [Gemmatimonadaceae bacterium]
MHTFMTSGPRPASAAAVRAALVAALATLVALAGGSVTASTALAQQRQQQQQQQPGEGALDGVARRADGGESISFALVRLLAAGDDRPRQQGITSADGHFRFARVPVGEYRVQLARIGYRPVLSPVLRVREGETLRYEIAAASDPVQLAAVVVHPEESCLGGARLGDEPQLAALWNEARDGVETRRAFEMQYRYVRTMRQDGRISYRFRGAKPLRRVDSLVNEPDSVAANDERRRAKLRAEGYSHGNLFVVPNEKDLLDDEFLRDHCLETTIAERGDGARGLRFRPTRAREGRRDIRGTIWVDGETYLTRRLEFEWVERGDVIGESSVDYDDLAVSGGTTLRLPSSGRAAIRRLSGPARAFITGGMVNFTYYYQSFKNTRE